MYAATGRELQLIAGQLPGDLCFLDRRDADWEQERSGLQSYGKSGVSVQSAHEPAQLASRNGSSGNRRGHSCVS